MRGLPTRGLTGYPTDRAMTKTFSSFRHWRRHVAVLACFLCTALPAQGQDAPPSSAVDSTFTLEPGDVLRVGVWREPDLSGDFMVNEAGRITLPMLGPVQITGRLWAHVRDSLLAQYAIQLRNPSVTLIPLRRVHVLGEVFRPGVFLADPTTSLAGLVALAGGATPNGDLHRVRVVRDGKVIVNNASVESLLLQSVRSNDQVFVDRRSWLERNGAVVASTLISAAGILVTILHR